MNQQYTATEVVRMMGVTRRQLAYWAKLQLVVPRARWGERFYSFADLVALETLKRLTGRGIAARRLRRAIEALETQLGEARTPLSRIRVMANGREVVVHTCGPDGKPIEPLTGQFVLQFDTVRLAGKVHAMVSRTAEEWFQLGLACDTTPETLEKAVEAYEHALEQAPGWMEAHINLGTALYQLQRLEEARKHFEAAVELEPSNPLAHFNLSCVLDPLGDTEGAIERLRRALALAPQMADAHLNLALAYEKKGRDALSRRHLAAYLQYQPRGPWADFARSRVHPESGQERSARSSGKVTPFRRKG
jgi:tetratricopeptide (TPR) repeat protein